MAIVLDSSGNLYPGSLCVVYMTRIAHSHLYLVTGQTFPTQMEVFFPQKNMFFSLQIAMQETPVRFLGGEDHLEKEMATHFSILAWETSWTEELGRLLSMGLQESDTS